MSGQFIYLCPQARGAGSKACMTLEADCLVGGAVLAQVSLVLPNCNTPAKVLRIHLVLTQQMCHGHIYVHLSFLILL